MAADPDPDLVNEILALYDLPESSRDVITAPAPRKAREQRYRETLPGHMAEIAESLSAGLPEGMRFEWAPE